MWEKIKTHHTVALLTNFLNNTFKINWPLSETKIKYVDMIDSRIHSALSYNILSACNGALETILNRCLVK